MKIVNDNITFGTKGDKSTAFCRIYTDIVTDKNLTHLALRLFIILANANDKKFTPTIGSLASQLGVGKTAIDEAVSNLKKYGYLVSSGERNNVVWNIHPIPLKANNKAIMNIERAVKNVA